jgi:O-acetyl-ADP-ribose deacetylase (regulator of RNase III)
MNEAGSASRRFGSVTLTVLQGDITEQSADAIVNSANNHFWMGGGVAGAIKRKGGAEIEREAMALGPAEPGESVTTGAGRLKAPYCIHAAVMGQDLATGAGLISKATSTALAEASRLNLDSVAFPALGTGVGEFPLPAAARLMVGAVLAHSRTNPKPTRVTFVLLDEPAYRTFVLALDSVPVP